ncbi:hypothetical protein [Algoriphagus aquimarinus]|uniref:hypothetical protein n=1 Tax=Algoriphagus aquimarinus TaxID=237018 RepID=UPI00174A7E91|nr:hypothetical protein [Algoriphagus aquimarinus]
MITPTNFGRISLFIIYFWFGILKVIGISPAEGLVENLFVETFGSFIDFKIFCLGFGAFECFIGILWLFPKMTKLAFYLLIAHMISTFLPVLILPEAIWQAWFTPTLVGQYIIKNFALISLAWFILKTYPRLSTLTSEVKLEDSFDKILVK